MISREDIAAKAAAAEAAWRRYIGDDDNDEWGDEAEALRILALEWKNVPREIDGGVDPVIAVLGR